MSETIENKETTKKEFNPFDVDDLGFAFDIDVGF